VKIANRYAYTIELNEQEVLVIMTALDYLATGGPPGSNKGLADALYKEIVGYVAVNGS
jgi:hypothetical protein